jgi:SAM-dependent methyltransferase
MSLSPESVRVPDASPSDSAPRVASDEFVYVGSELEAAAYARNWKRYFGAALAPYLQGRVLEVGAGLGGTTVVLRDGRQREWICLEPDPRLAAELERVVRAHPQGDHTRVITGDLATLDARELFDAILYIDVLEHIEDDVGELARAARHLAPGGALVVLAPAFQALFSEMDHALGHFRRYDRRSLAAVYPTHLVRDRVFYLDVLGTLASLANKFVLRQGAPRAGQLKLWDRFVTPVSRVLDVVIRRSFGRSVVAVYRKGMASAGDE